MTRFVPFLCLVALSAVGCGPTEVGSAYTAAAEADAGAETVETPAQDVLAIEPGDAPPHGDGEPAPDKTPAGDPPAIAEEEDEFFGSFALPSQTEPVSDGAAPADPAEPLEPRELELLVPTHTFLPAGDGTLRVTFDDLDLLKVLNAEPVPEDVVDHLPGWLKELDGQRITLRGFMYPTYADPVKAFILARDNQICCFGRNPKPYDLVTVKLAGGAESRYIQNRPFDVVGTFRLDPQHDGAGWLRLYRIDAARVVE